MSWKSKTDTYPDSRIPAALTAVIDPYSIIGRIGKTPLLKLQRIAPGNRAVGIFAKAEWFNPGGSVKDRAVWNMVQDGIRSGNLTKDKIIIDATSGNTGIAYAMIGSALGYRVVVALPENAGDERKFMLQAYGAEIIPTDPLTGTDGAQERVRTIVAKDPERYFYPDQYNNPANWRAHYHTTAEEIWEQTRGRVTHFIAGIGTSGTFIGTSRKLKEYNPRIRCISFEPDSPLHGIEGLKHLPTALTPGIYDSAVADEHRVVSTDEAYAMTRRLAREEGMFAGISSGAALAVTYRIASELHSGIAVTIFPDGGSRYTGERFWTESSEGEKS